MERLTEVKNNSLGTKGNVTISDMIKRLAYYEDLEESGLLHISPVEDGIEIFYVDDRDFMGEGAMVLDDSYLNGFTEYCHGQFNKDWFLTREEAELKLKEINYG